MLETSAASRAQVPRTLTWHGDATGNLGLLDQTLLPTECREIVCATVEQVWEAIKRLRVRGAPAIGVAVAYGVVIGTRSARNVDRRAFDQRLREVTDYLATSRPTAVNLFWALERLRQAAAAIPDASATQVHDRLLVEARSIEAEDRAMCAAIGRHGAKLLPDRCGVLTHCNAGRLCSRSSRRKISRLLYTGGYLLSCRNSG